LANFDNWLTSKVPFTPTESKIGFTNFLKMLQSSPCAAPAGGDVALVFPGFRQFSQQDAALTVWDRPPCNPPQRDIGGTSTPEYHDQTTPAYLTNPDHDSHCRTVVIGYVGHIAGVARPKHRRR
jgi:hypothetical protein